MVIDTNCPCQHLMYNSSACESKNNAKIRGDTDGNKMSLLRRLCINLVNP